MGPTRALAPRTPSGRRDRFLSLPRRPLTLALRFVAAVLLLPAAFARAESPGHGEFQVNSYTTGHQEYPALAAEADGEFVVVWVTWANAGADTDGMSLAARRFGAAGALGAELEVNVQTSSHQDHPAVAADGDDGFVVAWDSLAHAGADTDYRSVAARRFAATPPPGDELEVNTATTGEQWLPAVAIDAVTGRFLVAWEDDDVGAIHARRYLADGQPDGGPFAVGVATFALQWNPAVAAVGADEFVVIWDQAGQYEDDDPDGSVQGRRIDAAGGLGEQFRVNSYTTGTQYLAAVASDGAGRFVVAWQSDGSAGTDTDGFSIQAQRFDADGPVGDPIQVNEHTAGNQTEPAVAVDPRGHFVVAWTADSSPGTDADAKSVHARRLGEDGVPLGGQFQVNAITTGDQFQPCVGADSRGDFVVVWQSDHSPGTDTDVSSILGQRFDDVFRDGFEAGNWARWSMSLP